MIRPRFTPATAWCLLGALYALSIATRPQPDVVDPRPAIGRAAAEQQRRIADIAAAIAWQDATLDALAAKMRAAIPPRPAEDFRRDR